MRQRGCEAVRQRGCEAVRQRGREACLRILFTCVTLMLASLNLRVQVSERYITGKTDFKEIICRGGR